MNIDNFTHDLPEGWAEANLKELIGLDGVLTDGDWIETKDQDPQGNVRLIQLADIGDGFYRNRSQRFLTYETAQRLKCTFLKPGDVLVARMPEPLGRACIFPGDEKPAVTAVDVCIIRTGSPGVDHSWIVGVVNSPKMREEFERLQKGITRKRISKKNLISVKFPVPPYPEQRRIGAKIEELLDSVQKATNHLERVPAIIENFRKAVLNGACSGRLTEDWREKHSKYEPWKQVDFFDFCILQRGYDLPIKKCKPGPYPVVSSSGIAAFHCEFKAKGPGVTVGRSGSTGKVHYVEEDFWPHNTTLFVKDFKGNLPKYVYYFLLGFNFQRFSASTAVPTLNRNTLRRVKVKVPPVDEQVEIVRQVERLFDLANSIERRVKTATEKTEKLTQSILSKAFRGEFVPTEAELARRQGRTYETAEQLLARIKLEREKKRTIELKGSEIKGRSKVMGVLRGLKKRPILEVLSEAKGKLKPEELFQKANFTEEYIDDFYEELRAAVQAGQIKESRPKKTEIYLEAVKT